jgi:ABC-type transport system involved in multi-copper enzyme maturation permease subunit
MTAQMKMLLWKDLRLNWIVILCGITMMTLPYQVLLLGHLFPKYFAGLPYEGAWPISGVLFIFAMAILAGNIIACERPDRSAEFLAYQGASRKMVIASKLIICVAVFVSIGIIHFGLSFLLPPPQQLVDKETWNYQFIDYLIGLNFFACCWLMSSMLSGPGFAIVIGSALSFTTFFLFWLVLFLPQYYFNWLKGPTGAYVFDSLWISFIIAAALISLVAGTWYFIKSKEA